jgi:lipopolysaccharide/colanic/teichoic acid biosynthesis glycosyltransferase
MEDSKEKLRYDLYYVKNMSILFDMLILLATARAVIRGAGVG